MDGLAVHSGARAASADLRGRELNMERMIQDVLRFRKLNCQINSGTMLMLLVIGRHPDMSVSELRKLADMNQSAASRHIQLLVDMGLVDKYIDAESLRVKRCRLSETGMAHMKEIANA